MHCSKRIVDNDGDISKGTDFDFSISCDLYHWDLGPEFIGTFTY